MRPSVALAIFLNVAALGGAAHAQVIRCVDAAGNVSYTDQKCPSNTRSAEQVMGAEATDPRLAPPAPEPPPSARSAPSTNAQVPVPPPTIDRFAAERAETQRRESERQRRAAEYAEDNANDSAGYPYPAYPYPNGRYRQPGPPQDMRPQLRSCDAGGCNDTLGNRYNPSGKLQSYQGLNGQKCQPVGTTVVCR